MVQCGVERVEPGNCPVDGKELKGSLRNHESEECLDVHEAGSR
jgi:hypothetical protein